MNIAVPLRPWAWSLTWLFIIWGLIALLVQQFYETAMTPACKLDNSLLSKQLPSSLNSPLVIAIGDSLLKHATPTTQWLDNDIRWFRSTISSARQKQFSSMLVAIGKVKPRILLVQDSLLLEQTRRTQSSWTIQAKITLHYLASLIVTSLQKNRCDRVVANWNPRPRTDQNVLLRKDELRQRYAKSLVLSESSKQWLIQLQNLADQVVIVHFPRSLNLSTNTGRVQWLKSIQTELANLNVGFFKVGKPLDESYYIDGSHVNLQGRTLRMQQLAPLIQFQL